MIIIKIKNIQVAADDFCGKTIQPDAYYTIQSESERERFENNLKVNNYYSNMDGATWDPKILINDGESDLGYEDGLNLLHKSNQLVAIREEFTPTGAVATGGSWQGAGYKMPIDSGIGTVSTMELSWPFPVSIFSAKWNNKAILEDDEVEFAVAPDTVVGAITSDVAIDDDIINVSQTVVDNMKAGIWLKLTAGASSEDLGRVIEVDAKNLQVTVENAATIAFAAATPTYVRMTAKMIPQMYMDASGPVVLGEDAIGGSYIPTGKILKLTYKNNEGSAKDFKFLIAYKY